MQMKMKVGIGLMALGAGVWVAWSAWTRTRRVDPVDIPVSIAVGQSTAQSFTLNYDGLYLVEIVADTPNASWLEAFGAEWSLGSGGVEVAKGSTAEAHSAPSGSAGRARVIGEFSGRAGKSYQLQVKATTTALRDARARNARLRVAVSGLAKENLQAASVLVFAIMFICELFGMVLIAVGLWGKKVTAQPV